MRRRVVRARQRARMVTSGLRTLPDFLIVGGMRCGTSSLYKYLGYHPLVIPSLRKEIHYLSVEFDRGEAWYRSHFPTAARRRLVRAVRGREPLAFEATPDYLFHPYAPSRAAALVPDARIIALLRDPVERAISHYFHGVRAGFETLPLEEALLREEERIGPDLERLRRDPLDRCFDLRAFSYVARGIYADQLEAWFACYPRSRVLVVRSEDLFGRPGETYAEILRFLDLPPWRPPRFPNYSYQGGERREDPRVPPEVRRWLEEQFEPHNRRLYDLLGRDLGW